MYSAIVNEESNESPKSPESHPPKGKANHWKWDDLFSMSHRNGYTQKHPANSPPLKGSFVKESARQIAPLEVYPNLREEGFIDWFVLLAKPILGIPFERDSYSLRDMPKYGRRKPTTNHQSIMGWLPEKQSFGNHNLGDGFKCFLFLPLLGEMIQFD